MLGLHFGAFGKRFSFPEKYFCKQLSPRPVNVGAHFLLPLFLQRRRQVKEGKGGSKRRGETFSFLLKSSS